MATQEKGSVDALGCGFAAIGMGCLTIILSPFLIIGMLLILRQVL